MIGPTIMVFKEIVDVINVLSAEPLMMCIHTVIRSTTQSNRHFKTCPVSYCC